MPTVLGLCGSLRAASHNATLLEVVAGMLPESLPMRTFERLADIPPHNAELDTDPAPAAVAELRAAIRAADGLIITTPEYNHSIPGVLHNALNWASRPTSDLPLTGKAIAVLVATRGARLGHRSLAETSRILNGFGNIVVPGPEIVINNAPEHLRRDAEGTAHLTGLPHFVGGFGGLAERLCR
jgi:chromate reductase